MKSDKKWPELSSISKWDGVEQVWSTSGDWDWCVKLDKQSSTPEKAEAFVSKVRDGHWASATKTNWWKEVAAK